MIGFQIYSPIKEIALWNRGVFRKRALEAFVERFCCLKKLIPLLLIALESFTRARGFICNSMIAHQTLLESVEIRVHLVIVPVELDSSLCRPCPVESTRCSPLCCWLFRQGLGTQNHRLNLLPVLPMSIEVPYFLHIRLFKIEMKYPKKLHLELPPLFLRS